MSNDRGRGAGPKCFAASTITTPTWHWPRHGSSNGRPWIRPTASTRLRYKFPGKEAAVDRTATGEGLWFVLCAWVVDGTRNESFLQRWCLLCVWRKSIDRKIEQIVSWCCSGLRGGMVKWGGNGNNKWTALISLGKDQVLSLDRPQENPLALFVRSFVQSSFLPFFWSDGNKSYNPGTVLSLWFAPWVKVKKSVKCQLDVHSFQGKSDYYIS